MECMSSPFSCLYPPSQRFFSQPDKDAGKDWDTNAANLRNAGYLAMIQLAESKQEVDKCQCLLQSLQAAHDELQVRTLPSLSVAQID